MITKTKNTQNQQSEDSIELYSFDVFDTLITRKTASPLGIFALMQNALLTNQKYTNLNPFVKNGFYTLRTQAEQYLRATLDLPLCQDITLDEIYGVISHNNCLSKEETLLLKELEIQTEIKNILPISSNIETLKDLVLKGKRVVLISDMYHSSVDIKKLLTHVDPVFETIKIYVSSESKKTKYSGDFYQFVRNEEGVDYSKWLHTGDNEYADVKMSSKTGIKALHYEYCVNSPNEKYLSDNYAANPYVSLSAGASKNCRLLCESDEKFEIGASYGGPLFFFYVMWLLSVSKKKGIKRLYFIARDGYVLKKIADIVISEFNYDIRTEYIYGSRDAWRMASLVDENFDVELMFNYMDMTDFEKISTVFHLQLNELMACIPEKLKNTKGKFSLKTIETIKRTLSDSNDFKKLILKKAAQERARVTAYLQQEVDFSDDNFIFVEFKGTGATQDALNRIFSEFYSKKIKTFFFALDKNQFGKESDKLIFFPNWDYNHYAFEALLRAPHGQTIGYEYDADNRVRPILESGESQMLLDWGIERYMDGIEAYSQEVVKSLKINELFVPDLTVYCANFDYLFSSLDKVTAEIIGAIPFSDGVRNDKYKELAPPITLKDILKWRYSEKKHQGHCYGISLARSCGFVKIIINLLEKTSSFGKFLFSVRLRKSSNEAYVQVMGKRFNIGKLIGWNE